MGLPGINQKSPLRLPEIGTYVRVPNHDAPGGVPVAATMAEMTWQAKAACRGPHALTFFPPASGERRHERAEREQRAKAICAQCSVRSTCLDYALSIRERHGVWGGLSESERRVMLKVESG